MMGFAIRSTASYRVPCSFMRHWSIGVRPRNSWMSAPAVKAFGPAPVMTTARTFASVSNSCNARMSSSFIIIDIAFSLSGRLRVMRPAESRRLARMVSKFMRSADGRPSGDLSPCSGVNLKPGCRPAPVGPLRRSLPLERRFPLLEERAESLFRVGHREQPVLQLPLECEAFVHRHLEALRHGSFDESDGPRRVLR